MLHTCRQCLYVFIICRNILIYFLLFFFFSFVVEKNREGRCTDGSLRRKESVSGKRPSVDLVLDWSRVVVSPSRFSIHICAHGSMYNIFDSFFFFLYHFFFYLLACFVPFFLCGQEYLLIPRRKPPDLSQNKK